ncbi:arylsulfatase A-like enzyme [Rhodopirellula rubra]|uniref:Arylsulfatase A-like enzyme n=1 Tax=Aporhodopirellula rubra TaxID=980271 RepID=A0A7W5DYM8_9BACT|nr:arylsulfatase A-like enzyme [Aporhodopirellula rubra]
MRVPAVIRWPNMIPAGSNTDKLLTAMDVLPTCAKLSGAELPNDLVIDGKDMMPVLLNGAASPHEHFFYVHWGDLEGVRWKSWKLHVVDGKTALYNLDEDIAEKKNLAANHPEIVQQLQSAMQAFEKDMKENLRPAGLVENPKPLTKR